MKKNGFTLVEITVCVVLLVTIFLLVVPKVNTMIKQKKQDSYNSLISTIKDAAQAYVYLNVNIVDDAIESQGYYEVSIRTLQENELLENKLENPLTGKNIPSTSIVKIIKNNEEYIYKFSLDYQYLLEHIIDLYSSEETRTSNGLKKDNTPDQNIRYYGSDPNNYVRFNNELWRIIGVFGNNVKLVRSESLGKLSWDSSASSVNNGWGVNEWSQADLQVYLNKMYYGGTSVTCYNGENNTTTTCPTNTLDEISKSLIDYHTWNTGAPNDSNITMESYDTLAFYQTERGSVNGKNCTGGKYCNDRVKRTTTWTGYVALPYITDWAYASGEYICETNMNDGVRLNVTGYQYKYTCGRNNWMNRSGETWYLSPFVNAAYACAGCYLPGVGGYEKYAGYAWANVGGSHAAGNATFFSSLFFPTIYLKSNILIESGKGTSDNPYILKAGS